MGCACRRQQSEQLRRRSLFGIPAAGPFTISGRRSGPLKMEARDRPHVETVWPVPASFVGEIASSCAVKRREPRATPRLDRTRNRWHGLRSANASAHEPPSATSSQGVSQTNTMRRNISYERRSAGRNWVRELLAQECWPVPPSLSHSDTVHLLLSTF